MRLVRSSLLLMLLGGSSLFAQNLVCTPNGDGTMNCTQQTQTATVQSIDATTQSAAAQPVAAPPAQQVYVMQPNGQLVPAQTAQPAQQTYVLQNGQLVPVQTTQPAPAASQGNATVVTNYYVASAPAAAAAPDEPKGYHTHDGFYLHFSLGWGVGFLTQSMDGYDNEADYDGASASFAMKIGGSLSKAIAMYVLLHDFVISEPDYDNGYSSGALDGVSIGIVGFGVGATIYPGEGNFYISPSISYASVGWSGNGGNTAYSTHGTLFRADVGYEWWVSTNWGLGLALSYQHYSGEEDGLEDSANFIGLLFSATFN